MKSLFLTVVTVPLLCHLTQGCCTPEQWSGDMGFLVGTNNNGKGGYEAGKVKLFYDAKNTKIASFSEGVINGKFFKGAVVQNFEEGVQYIVVNGNCNTTKLRREFKRACVPSESKQVSDTHLGTSTDSLDVSTYEMPLKRYRGNAYFMVTNKLCIPIGDTITGGTEKGINARETIENGRIVGKLIQLENTITQNVITRGGFMASIGYTGFEPGINDPRVFDKPRECRSKIEEVEIDIFEKFGMFNHKMSSLF